MYIGPWQEYKLAHVIKIKNDLYEGNLNQQTKLTEKSLKTHNDRIITTDSTTTNRSFFSENLQRQYPRFNVDTYYKQWKHVENILTKSVATNIILNKPPIPKSIRQKQGKSFQAQRIKKMRTVYSLEDKKELKLPSINHPQIKIHEEKLEKNVILPSLYNKKHEEILDEIEENQIDGLLQWVKELPEELSLGSSDMNSHGMIL
ncbi:hypothetical protein SteCoe_29491 [Stentor coeruleus]|uniref:Uncharacterized protein n=1 Tax=Stentor coeruleus TaxID=5963 RepID=A0A1R2B5T7_9CILI|nr:hypothetical protein SteCoe_29491 [Stentor coeruleus]